MLQMPLYVGLDLPANGKSLNISDKRRKMVKTTAFKKDALESVYTEMDGRGTRGQKIMGIVSGPVQCAFPFTNRSNPHRTPVFMKKPSCRNNLPEGTQRISDRARIQIQAYSIQKHVLVPTSLYFKPEAGAEVAGMDLNEI